MDITPVSRTASEIAALTQTAARFRTAKNTPVITRWRRDAYVADPATASYLNDGKTSRPTGSVPAPPYANKIDSMSEAEIRTENVRLRKEVRTTDYTGMSDVEIYQCIYNRYAEAFGEDYMSVPIR
jgi:hypothetical protein